MARALAILGCSALLVLSGCDEGGGGTFTPPPQPPLPPPQPACGAVIRLANIDPNRPVITLKGQDVVKLAVGTAYTDAGATAMDPVEGDLTSRMVVTGLETLNVAATGDYLIRYNVTNSRTSAADEVVRMVRVHDALYARQSRREYGATSAVMGYFEHLPLDYGADPARTFPVIFYHHGIGESVDFTQVDTDTWSASPNKLDLMLRRGLPAVFDRGTWDDARPFIVLSPQRCTSFADDRVEDFVQYALRTYKIDRTRIYHMGFSAGSLITWEHIRLNPTELAAAITISGGGNTTPLAGCRMKDTPTWSFHAADDRTVPVGDTINTIASIRACSPTVPHKLTVFPTGGHLIDMQVLQLQWLGQGDPAHDLFDQDLYQWLLGFTRAPAAGISFETSTDSIQEGQSVTLHWSAEGATSCAASGDWFGTRKVRGVERIAPATAGLYSYVLSCSGPAGSKAQAVTVSVSEAP